MTKKNKQRLGTAVMAALAAVLGSASPTASAAVLALPLRTGLLCGISGSLAAVIFNGKAGLSVLIASIAAAVSKMRFRDISSRSALYSAGMTAGAYTLSAASFCVFSGGGMPEFAKIFFDGAMLFVISLGFLKASGLYDSGERIPSGLIYFCLFGTVYAFSGCHAGPVNAGAVAAAYSVMFFAARESGAGAVLAAGLSAAGAGISDPLMFREFSPLLAPALLCGFLSSGSTYGCATVMILGVIPSAVLFGGSRALDVIISSFAGSVIYVLTARSAARAYSKIAEPRRKEHDPFGSATLRAALSELSDKMAELGSHEVKQCVFDGISKRQSGYISGISDEKRHSAQLCSDMLLCMEEALSDYEKISSSEVEKDLTKRFSDLLDRAGIKYLSVRVSADCSAVMVISVSQRVNDIKLSLLLSEATALEYSRPERMAFGEELILRFYPCGELQPESGICQLSATKGVSGDCAESFVSGGSFYMIISDGMGRGQPARAVSASLVSAVRQLITAGFSVMTAINLGAQILKSAVPEESFATLDILKADLMNGSCEMYKAGGCASAVFSGENRFAIRAGGYPCGILMGCEVKRQRFCIDDGAWVIMMSDGAQGLTPENIWDVIKNCKNRSAKEVAEELLELGIKDKSAETDDVTVAAVKIGKKSL